MPEENAYTRKIKSEFKAKLTALGNGEREEITSYIENEVAKEFARDDPKTYAIVGVGSGNYVHKFTTRERKDNAIRDLQSKEAAETEEVSIP